MQSPRVKTNELQSFKLLQYIKKFVPELEAKTFIFSMGTTLAFKGNATVFNLVFYSFLSSKLQIG